MLPLIFSGWIVLFPFVMLYGAFEGPKVVWTWMGGFFLTLYWTVKLLLLHPLKVSPVGRWFLGWIGVLGVASLIGIHPVESIIGGSYRHQGILLFFTLFLTGETLRQLSQKHTDQLYSLLGFSVIAESVFLLSQKLFGWMARPFGTFGEPNAAGGFLAIGLWWIISWPKIPKVLRFLFFVTTLAAILATQSRTALVCGIIMMVAFILKMMNRKNRPLFFVALATVLLVIGLFGYRQYQVITRQRPSSVYENRTLYWTLGVGEFMKRPILGYGAETEDVVYQNAFLLQNIRLIDLMIDRSHNIFLDVTLWSGIVGLVVFIGWLIVIAKQLVNSNVVWRFAPFAVWLVFAFVQPLGVVQWLQLILLSALV